jgi:Circularly permutated YpsA SLOG family
LARLTRSRGGRPAFGPERQPPAEPSDDLIEDLRADLRAGLGAGKRAGPRGGKRAGPVARAGIAVLTGGQTGVDTLAARAALAAELPVHLFLPRGFRQEDGPITPARRRAVRGAALHELTSAEFAPRTWTCVSLVDAVILIDPAGGEGCQETIRAARHLGRPLLDLTASLQVPGSTDPFAPGTEVTLAVREFIGRNKPHLLMIAGCRGSLLARHNKTAEVEACVAAIAAVVSEWQGRLPG